MQKRIIITILVILSVQLKLLAFDGVWGFENMFSQYVVEGKATIQPLHIPVIRKIIFSSAENDNRYKMIKGKIEVLNSNDEYENIDIQYLVLKNLITISSIEGSFNITIFYTKDLSGEYWYSYALSESEFKEGIVNGSKASESAFLNVIGIMKKVDK